MTVQIQDQTTATQQFRDYHVADVDYALSYTPVVDSFTSSGQTTVKDIVYDATGASQVKTGAIVTAVATGNLASGALDGSTLECMDLGAVGSFDASSGRLTAGAESASARVICHAKIPRLTVVQTTVANSSGVSVFNSYQSGSVSRAANDLIDSLLNASDHTNSSYRKLFTTGLFGIPNAWNPTRWCSSVDLTCFSCYNADSGLRKAGTLISPRHIIHTNHFAFVTPCTIFFIGSDGATYTATVIAGTQIGSSDVMVSILDADIPSVVKPALILPATATTNKIPSVGDINNISHVPVICTNQDKTAFVGDLFLNGGGMNVYRDTLAPESLWANGVRSGDSSCPIFLALPGQTCLISAWGAGAISGAWVGGGADYSSLITQINSTMHSLSVAHGAPNDYQLTTADLSAYSSY